MIGLRVLLIILWFFSGILMAAPQTMTLWHHQASAIEMKALFAALERFNSSQNEWEVVPDFIPEASYTLSTRAAAQAGLLPCVIEIDQPLVPNFAWNGYILPLEGLVDDAMLKSINTSGKGTYRGKVYSVGPLDVSLALFTSKSLIQQTGARYPTMEQPWTKDEFMAFLEAVKATGSYKYPLDMRAQDMTEWIPYAWAPMMLSWGSDLIDRTDYITVDGVLNSAEAVEFGQWIQWLVRENYMDAHPDNDNGFVDGDVAIQYGGSWALSRYYDALKDDLAVLPVPDFGHGSFVGSGTWHWAVTESCRHPGAAKALINFLMTPEEQLASTNVIGMFPANSHAADLSKYYGEQGQWRMLYDFSRRFSKARPETPAYAVISSSYKQAMRDILKGMSPKVALDLAVENIKASFDRHQGYMAPSH